jgi:anthranilate/para-aminobenzoate synthase component II
MNVTFIDHYDSFSLNIVDWLINSDFIVEYCRFDEPGLVDYLIRRPRPLVVSPGPFAPTDYPESLRLISNVEGQVPIFGICLGFQMLGVLHKARILKVCDPFHGSPQILSWASPGLNRKNDSLAISYNSLRLDISSCGTDVDVLASSQFGYVQCARFVNPGTGYSSLGLQFHPESFAGESYDFLLSDFAGQVRAFEAGL